MMVVIVREVLEVLAPDVGGRKFEDETHYECCEQRIGEVCETGGEKICFCYRWYGLLRVGSDHDEREVEEVHRETQVGDQLEQSVMSNSEGEVLEMMRYE